MTTDNQTIPEKLEGVLSQWGHRHSCDELLAVATPEIFLLNAFRRTGLSVLSGLRDIARRADQIRMALELGLPSFDWAFAPETPLNADQLREVSQILKDPRRRIIQEFFWFWPLTYPTTSEDPALDHLARNEPEQAYAIWRQASLAGNLTATHNLALYFHLVALDSEAAKALPGEELEAMWRQALEFWNQIADEDRFWESLTARIKDIADPLLPLEMAREMRASLPDALSRINALLTLRHAEKGEAAHVQLHASLVGVIHRNAAAMRRTLEACAGPVARRIDALMEEARSTLARDPLRGLGSSEALFKSSAGDLSLIETLCGRASEFYVELSSSVAATCLECLVIYQRETRDSAGCLPLMEKLVGMSVLPELSPRIESASRIMRGAAEPETNAVVTFDNLDTIQVTGENHVEIFERLSGKLIPELEKLTLSNSTIIEFSTKMATLLHRVAQIALQDPRRMAFALGALQKALQISCDLELRAVIESERDSLQERLRQQSEMHYRLESGEDVLEIGLDGIRYNSFVVSPAEINGVRHFTEHRTINELLTEWFEFSWCSSSFELTLDTANFFNRISLPEVEFNRMLDAFYYFFSSDMIARIVAQIHSGETVYLGRTPMKREGMPLASKSLFWKTEEFVPYSKLRHSTRINRLTISHADNPGMSESFHIGQTWNAVIIGHVIDKLARQD